MSRFPVTPRASRAAPSVAEVLALLRELEKLGVKPAQYDIHSPWSKPVPRRKSAK